MKLGCILLAALLLPLYGCMGSNSSGDDIRNKPLEYKLAYLDSSGYVKDDDVKVVRFRFLLESLSNKTGETKEAIGDQTVQATEVLRTKYGKEIKNLELMEQANDYFKSGPKTSYRDVTTMLIILMGQ